MPEQEEVMHASGDDLLRQFPIMRSVLGAHFSVLSDDDPLGSTLSAHFADGEAPAKLRLKREIRETFAKGIAVQVLNASTTYPLDPSVFEGQDEARAMKVIKEKIWDFFWPGEQING